MKFILISGSCLSGIGKGVVASSIGVLLQNIGVSVTAIKIDPYMNIDAGLMNPSEHGEVYVLSDGAEVDLDFGSYERFLNIKLTREHSITSGKIYSQVISRERQGSFLGKTVQVVPHITDAVQSVILDAAKRAVDDLNSRPEVCIVELGGTVGDIESMPFVEALRQLQGHEEVETVCNVHVSWLPEVNDEFKTKPIQHSVAHMRSTGLSPDILICRHASNESVPISTVDKCSKMCGIKKERVIPLATEKILWKVPLILDSVGMSQLLCQSLHIQQPKADINVPSLLQNWKSHLVDVREDLVDSEPLDVALIGKYHPYTEAYLSVIRALQHACLHHRRKLSIRYIDVEKITKLNLLQLTLHVDCILVPGGFGERGNKLLIDACTMARVNKIPFFGICLGFQMAVIEYAREVCGERDAVSTEFDTRGTPYIIHMPDYSKKVKGSSMRLGSHDMKFKSDVSLTKTLYGAQDQISERYRHRYEVNPEHISKLEQNGLLFTGTSLDGLRMQIFELDKTTHPFYVGCQFHPEFQSRPLQPHPLFKGFIEAAMKYNKLP